VQARALAAAYATLALLIAGAFVIALLVGGFRAIERSDYMTYHLAGRMITSGDAGCLYDLGCQSRAELALIGEEPTFTNGPLPFNSPPTVALLALPFSLLSLTAGFVAWAVLSLAVLGYAAWRLSWGGTSTRLIATVLVLSAWPTAMAAVRGQLSILVVGLVGLSAAWVSRPDGGVGAGVTAGLGSLKPTLVPLLWAWYAVARRWRVLGITLLTAAAALAVSAIVVGPQTLAAYPGYLLDAASSAAPGIHVDQMINWRGAAARLDGGALGSAVLLAGTILTLAAVAATWWWSRRSEHAVPVALAAAFIATPLVIPHANQHEAMLAELGVLVLLAGVPEVRRLLVPVAIGLHLLLWIGPALSGATSGWLLFTVQLALLGVVAAVAARTGRYYRLVPVRSRTA
jgi:hypothetical protein